MKIVARLDKYKHAYLDGELLCAQFNNFQPVHFLVDTGCTFTTILGRDSYMLGLDFKKMQQASCFSNTASGRIVPYELPNARLKFWTSEDSAESHVEIPLRFIHCMPPPTDLNQLPLLPGYSLLGMDVLQFFRNWQYTDTALVLRT